MLDIKIHNKFYDLAKKKFSLKRQHDFDRNITFSYRGKEEKNYNFHFIFSFF